MDNGDGNDDGWLTDGLTTWTCAVKSARGWTVLDFP